MKFRYFILLCCFNLVSCDNEFGRLKEKHFDLLHDFEVKKSFNFFKEYSVMYGRDASLFWGLMVGKSHQHQKFDYEHELRKTFFHPQENHALLNFIKRYGSSEIIESKKTDFFNEMRELVSLYSENKERLIELYLFGEFFFRNNLDYYLLLYLYLLCMCSLL